MPVRLRITLLFSAIAFIILSLVCSGIYYFSHRARTSSIKTRLTNRAITTARLLSQREVFDRRLIQRIDSSTTIALKDKSVQAYNTHYRRIYRYSDLPNDTLPVSQARIDEAITNGNIFFSVGGKEAVGYHYKDAGGNMVVFVAGEDQEGKNNLHNLLRILLLSFLVGNIFVLISGYFFSRGLLRPIKQISKDAAEISAQNLARRIETGKTKDEWYQLSVTLNELLNRLQESFDMQRRFISNASHELSTPLTAISSQLEVALQKERDAEAYRKVMQSIYQDVLQLTRLTQTLLEFAKASGSAGGLEIDLLRIDEVLLVMPSEVAKINSQYVVQIDFREMPEQEEPLLVFGNEALLSTAIKNIVVNACKFSPTHQAFLTLSIVQNRVVVEISDQGPGIPEQEIANIFQPFYRMDENRSVGGFGLGLPLADRIIKIHKGVLSVQSTQGVGTTFTIELPQAKSLRNLQQE